jgi:hypothetical protein
MKTIELLQNSLAVTLQRAMDELGFLPNGLGEGMRGILSSDDPSVIIACGCCLDECMAKKSYDDLTSLVARLLETNRIQPVFLA